MLGAAVGRSERLLFAIVFWLSPWWLYCAGDIWNASWLVPFGVLHTVTASRLRERAVFWPSFGHVVAIGALFQLHQSLVILMLAPVILLAVRHMRLHRGGAALAAAVVGASLLPWLQAVRVDPALLPGGAGFVGRGLVLGFPLLRGVGYPLRYASLSFSDRMTTFDFTPALGCGADALLAPTLRVVTVGVGLASVFVPLLAHCWLWPRPAHHWRCRRLTPTTVVSWQGFAVLPVVLFAAIRLRSRRSAIARRIVVAWLAATVVVAAAMAIAGPMYPRGGRLARTAAPHTEHPMVDQLGISTHCTVAVDPVNGWWVNALSWPGAPPAPPRR